MEKWMQSKSRTMTIRPIKVSPKGFYGKPANLFRDSDGDGVPNVFDCSPHNKRRQDIMAPFSGSNPTQEMFARQEAARQAREYQKYLNELRKQETLTSTTQTIYLQPEVVDRTVTLLYPGVWDKQGGRYVPATSKKAQEIMSKEIAGTTGVDTVPKITPRGVSIKSMEVKRYPSLSSKIATAKAASQYLPKSPIPSVKSIVSSIIGKLRK